MLSVARTALNTVAMISHKVRAPSRGKSGDVITTTAAYSSTSSGRGLILMPEQTGEETEDCPYCWGEGTVKRRYGTVGPGPAKIVKRRDCPLCEGVGTVTDGVTEFDE
jgi:DnaJ-class molecular chaperone